MELGPVEDWSRWTQMPSVRLWMAVALSCNIEPMTIPLEVMRAEAEMFDGCSVFLSDYRERRRIADAHAREGASLPLHKRLDDVPDSWVLLEDLRTFGESLEPPWTFPEGFPRVVLTPTDVGLESVGEEGFAPQPEHDNDGDSASRAVETREERQRRRFDRYGELGGIRVAQQGGGWRAGGTRGALAALSREEAAAGRPWNNVRDVARDLDDEAERRRADRAMPRG